MRDLILAHAAGNVAIEIAMNGMWILLPMVFL